MDELAKRVTVAAAALVAVLVASGAHAQVAAESPKRPVPDYDGMGPPPKPQPGLWVPRVLLSPLYFTSEFVLRRPIGAITREMEKAKLPEKAYDFFAFGPDHTIGFAPVALAEFGFNPSIGVWGFWDDAIVKHNHVRLHIEVWPTDWLAETLTDRFDFTKSTALTLRGVGFARPDQVFYGLGSDSAQYHQSRFTERLFDASAMVRAFLWRSTRFEVQAGVRKVELTPGHYGSDPSLEVEARTGAFALPFGFERGYLAPYGRALFMLDTRARDATTGSGVRLEAHADGGGDAEHAPASGWIHYGGSATVFVDLDDHGRVLSLAAATMFADPIGDQPIPFTELVTLGGDNWLHGFYPGRLRDRSGAVAQLEYTWPVAPWLNGTLNGAVGNVFGEHLTNFDPKLLRVSAGIGLSSTSNPPVEVLAAFGTETIEHGATVDAFRLSFGVPRLF
ncbi:MAG TPA: hypothetical protein VH054_21350 [Polyangiaceae bacterium]|jgi:hypothetical protein|nr:hypothetical protein [Polyangiaceae bacterium]